MAQDEVVREDWPLTSRQLQCLEGVWLRKSAKIIGHELGIGEDAVNKHLSNVRRILGVNSSPEAARLVFEGSRDTTIKYYYQESDVRIEPHLNDQPIASAALAVEAAGQQAPINTLGPGPTLLAIILVAIGCILGVAALIAAAQGANELWRALGH